MRARWSKGCATGKRNRSREPVDPPADEEIPLVGNREVVHHLGLGGLDRFDPGQAGDRSDLIAGLQIAGHFPALAGQPEAMDAGGEDGVSPDCKPQRPGRPVDMCGDDRLERQRARSRVLREDPIARGNCLDLALAVDRVHERAGRKACAMLLNPQENTGGDHGEVGHGHRIRDGGLVRVSVVVDIA